MPKIIHRKKRLSSFKLIVLGFAGVIVLGALILMLPFSSTAGVVTPFHEALFTSTSAVCVTGLVVQDTGSYWSAFGQTVILLLIQIGGLGVVTVAALFAMLSGRKISLMQRSTMQDAISAPKVGGIVRLTRFIVRGTFLIELIGMIVMLPTFCGNYGIKGIWMAAFHSVSAFCNAGFDILGTAENKYPSLTGYIGNLAPIIVTIATTAIFDGCALLLMPKPGGSVHKVFSKFLTRGLKGAVPLILFLVILILVRTLTNQTPYGKALRAIGGSENAAYSTGVKVKKVKFIAYCLAGLLCAAAGIFLSAQMNSADATIGKNYAMNAITATVVGGTAMTGAVGDPLGTIAGVFIISIINNMLNLFGVSSFYQFVCQGLILILALSLSAMHKKH